MGWKERPCFMAEYDFYPIRCVFPIKQKIEYNSYLPTNHGEIPYISDKLLNIT